MVKSEDSLLPARQGAFPMLGRLPRGDRLLWLLTLHVSAAMLCLAFVIFAHGLPLGVWPPLVALVLNVVVLCWPSTARNCTEAVTPTISPEGCTARRS